MCSESRERLLDRVKIFILKFTEVELLDMGGQLGELILPDRLLGMSAPSVSRKDLMLTFSVLRSYQQRAQ